MSRSQFQLLTSLTLVLLIIFQVAGLNKLYAAIDWEVGKCATGDGVAPTGEPKEISGKEHYECVDLAYCFGGNVACSTDTGASCPAPDDQTSAPYRVIKALKVGDCKLPTSGEGTGCKACEDPLKLICYTRRNYEDRNEQNECIDQCPKLARSFVASAGKCIP